ncbi:helix-turn-helix domain-containing protein [Streptomyces sp. NPDC056982]|uniref:helix-turn-helix domain-containing protein n=1 Tax=Streptomyces sp. NPDC056982 TaxID=3345986 RepID=UPI00362C60DE
MRAQVVLHAARGRSNARTAREETGLHVDTVRRWRGRFAAQGKSGPADRERSIRPPALLQLRRRPPNSRPWPANCPPKPGRRCPAGRARTWPARPRLVMPRPR